MQKYRKFKSDEIHYSIDAPDVVSLPMDKPAGAYAKIQRRNWKIWYQLNDLFNPTTIVGVWFRAGRKNDWVKLPDSNLALIPQPILSTGWNYTLQHWRGNPGGVSTFMTASSTDSVTNTTNQNSDWANDDVKIGISYSKGDYSFWLSNQPFIVMEVLNSWRRESQDVNTGDNKMRQWTHPVNASGPLFRVNANYGGGDPSNLDTEWPLITTGSFQEQVLFITAQNFYNNPGSVILPIRKVDWYTQVQYSLRYLNKYGILNTSLPGRTVTGIRQPIRFRFACISPLDNRSVILGPPSEVLTIQPKGGYFNDDDDDYFYDFEIQKGY